VERRGIPDSLRRRPPWALPPRR